MITITVLTAPGGHPVGFPYSKPPNGTASALTPSAVASQPGTCRRAALAPDSSEFYTTTSKRSSDPSRPSVHSASTATPGSSSSLWHSVATRESLARPPRPDAHLVLAAACLLTVRVLASPLHAMTALE